MGLCRLSFIDEVGEEEGGGLQGEESEEVETINRNLFRIKLHNVEIDYIDKSYSPLFSD